MPQPTNSELFGIFDKVTRLEFLPYPAVTYEEHFNTNFLLSLKRYSLLVEKILGAVKVDGYDVIKNGSNIEVTTGILFFKDFIVKEDSAVTIDSFVAEDRKVILKVTEEEYTYESNKAEVEEVVEGRSLSGPNQQRYTVEYLYQTGAVPADTATEFYLHLADVDSNGNVAKQIPARDELMHELATGETIITDQNYKTVESEIKNFFTNKEVDFGNGKETALFVDSNLVGIENPALMFRVESIESLSFNMGVDPSLDSQKSLFQNGLGTRVRVKFAWNYKTTVASGGNGTIDIDNSGFSSLNQVDPDFTVDQLIGYRIWFDGSWYEIIANGATSNGVTQIEVQDTSGNTPDLTGVSASGGSPAIIDNEASEYQIRARSADGQTSSVSIREREAGAQSPVKNEGYMELDFGKKYEIEFSTYSVLRFDEYSQNLNSGSITQWGSETLSYDASPDFIPKFADIPVLPNATASKSKDDPYSMKFTIPGISPSEEDFAESYEIIYNTESALVGAQEQLDFNGNYEHREVVQNPPSLKGEDKTVLLRHYVSAGQLSELRFKYRALIGMQVVSDVGTVTELVAFNRLDAPGNLSTEFLSEGMYEQNTDNDEFGDVVYADRRNNPAAVKVTWDAVEDAKGYHVQATALDSGGNLIEGTKRERVLPLENDETDTIGDEGVVLDYTVGRSLRIKVSALHLDSTKGTAASVDFQETIPRLSAPDFGEHRADEIGVTIPWTPVDGADHYHVFWSLTRNPQLGGSKIPSDQESVRTRNTKIRINAPAGSDLYIGIVTIDHFGRRSLDMSRLQTQSGKIQDVPPMKVWTTFEKPYVNDYKVDSSESDTIGTIRFTQPVRILGIAVRAHMGNYYEDGTLSKPSDGDLSDHPVKFRLYRSNEPSNNISVRVNGLLVENLIGTTTDVDRDPLLSVSANTILVLDYINEHSSYDLANVIAQVDVFYRYEDKIGETSEGRIRRTRSNI